MASVCGIGVARGEEFVCDSNEAIEFKLVRSVEDLDEDSTTFKPAMSHQIFGDSESIFGYKDLQVKLYYSACRLTMFLGQKYSSKVDPSIHDGLEADNVLKLLQEKLQIPFALTNLNEFVKQLSDDDSFQPYGEKINSFTDDRDGVTNQYVIYHCDTSNQKFIKFHERLQTFILFYIDAASYIDVDDSKWQFFVVYEQFKKGDNWCYAVAGYCTVYEYYAYPDHKRPRVSQMLVLPPFQRKGLGCRLLCAVYQHYKGCDTVQDITVEDPNEEFQHLRDYVDVCLCASLKSYAPELLVEGFTRDMASEACAKYKINKKQARRAYEILRLKHTNIYSEYEFSQYRLNVKKRLNAPFQKEAVLKVKLKHLLEAEPHLATTLGLKTPEERYETLQQMFSDTVKEYQSILKKVENDPLLPELF